MLFGEGGDEEVTKRGGRVDDESSTVIDCYTQAGPAEEMLREEWVIPRVVLVLAHSEAERRW
jgi:hypothetical protein